MSNSNAPLKVGVVGAGYWGPNLIRNFNQLKSAHLATIVDLDEERLAHMQEMYPDVKTSKDFRDITSDDSIEAVIIATPVATHAKLGLAALETGKHIFLEKPMASSVEECSHLVEEAEKRNLKIMVGHVFEYTNAVRKMKSLLDEGVLGNLYYVNSQRLNLGLFRPDVNVVWDLAPHDISILNHLLDGKMPRGVRCVGVAHLNPKTEDVATITVDFDDGLIAFAQLSWLDPLKVRQTTLVGSKKMLVYNDIEPTEKIWLYDRSVEAPAHYDTYDQFPFTYRYGDITIPRIGGAEPLRTEAQHFIECIREDKKPLTDGVSGLNVVRILQASSDSLREDGKRILIS